METSKNKLWDVDEKLFASLEGKYQSDNEAMFFRNMKFKQEYEPTLSNDLIISESDNEDEIYLVRVEYDEYLVGKGDDEAHEVHVMNLSEALSVDLSTVGLNRKLTLFEWLKQRDYAGVLYNRNYDDR
jgi:hypothetical protein